jgi:hypothetical protein
MMNVPALAWFIDAPTLPDVVGPSAQINGTCTHTHSSKHGIAPARLLLPLATSSPFCAPPPSPQHAYEKTALPHPVWMSMALKQEHIQEKKRKKKTAREKEISYMKIMPRTQ